MIIICPFCNTEREIEHISYPRNIRCVCGQKFSLVREYVKEEFSEIDMSLPEYVGKYKITGLIGFGGMGKVYQAIHPDLGIPVAVKSMKQEFSNDSTACGRFIRSARICARISHPNVVRIYDCNYDENNLLFLVMEYIDGGSAQSLIDKQGVLSSAEAAKIACGVCTGLIEAEARKIVHRDIKPENIMFASDGTIKLLDLGLAKISGDPRINDSSKFAVTLVNTSLGTPEYMSPEQALDAKSCDCRSDLYSLGVTMYQMVTGKYPFGSGDAAELKRKHALEPPPSPKLYNENIHPLMEKIILKCMEKKRSQRYQSAKELLLDLKAFLAGSSTLPSFRKNRKNLCKAGFSKWENSFNAPVFRKWQSWEYFSHEIRFLSPFRLFLLFLVIILTACFCAYITSDLSGGIPLDKFLNE